MQSASGWRWTPAITLAVGLLLTAAVTYAFHRSAEQRDWMRFVNAVEATNDRIETRLDTYVAMLRATRAWFAASPDVTMQGFRRYAEQLNLQERYPGIQGIGFSLRFRRGDRDRIEKQLAAQGQAGFHVWPAAGRDEYDSVVFLEPLDQRNQAAIGYDMTTEPVRREAMMRARDTGQPAASGKVTLVQEIDEHKQAGFLIYVPVYEGGAAPATVAERAARLKGFVYSPFRMDDLLAGIFGTEREPRVSFVVYDSAEATEATRMHGSRETGNRPRFESVRTLTVAGRPWTIAFRSQRALEETSADRALPYIFALGALFSGALFTVTRAQVRAREKAEASDRATQAERAHLRRLFAQAPAPIAIFRGPNHTLEFLNDPAKRLFGDRPLGKPVREAFPEVDPRPLVVLGRVYNSGSRYVGSETPLVLAWGDEPGSRQRFFNVVHEPMRASDGQVEGVMSFAFEVTDQVLARRRLEAVAESLQMQARVLESMSEGVSVSDEAGFILYTNAAEDRMFGYAPGELIGHHVTVQNRYAPEENERIVRSVIEQLRAGGVWHGEFENLRKDGTTFVTSARITALEVAGKRYWVCVQEDVTERKRVQQERERLLHELEQAVRARDDFLSVAGHELRTPLSALKLLVQWLQRHLQSAGDGAVRADEIVDKTSRQVDRLERLVSELLDVSRIAAGRLALQLEETDLAATVREVADRFLEQLERAHCELRLSASGQVTGMWDRSRIDQVVSNLVANAIKYGQGKPIEISVASAGDVATVSVRDHGIGIAEADRDRIFGRFERAVSQRHYGGLGLGLWISRQIVESHGGSIEFDSEPGAATTFTVKLPLRSRSTSGHELPESGAPHAAAG